MCQFQFLCTLFLLFCLSETNTPHPCSTDAIGDSHHFPYPTAPQEPIVALLFRRQWVGGGVGVRVEDITFAVNHLSGLISRNSWLIDHISLSLSSGDGQKIHNLLLGGRYLEQEGERQRERKRLFLSLSLFSLSLVPKFAYGRPSSSSSLYLFLSVDNSPTDLTDIIMCYTLRSSSILYIVHSLSSFYCITSFLFISFFFLFLSLFPSFPAFSPLSIYLSIYLSLSSIPMTTTTTAWTMK